MNSSLLLQQCLACLVRLIWMVFVMGGRCPYSCCFMGCCLQDLFNTTCNILVQFFNVISMTLIEGGSYPSVEMQSVYPTDPAGWALQVNSKAGFYLSKTACLKEG